MSADSTHSTPSEATLPQLTRRGILMVWAAAAVPMGLLAWVAAPILAGHLTGTARLGQALIITLTARLLWQFVLVVVLVRRESGTLNPVAMREALWIRAPRSPRTGQPGGRAWLALVPAALAFALMQLVPAPSHPSSRDTGHVFLAGSWGWFAVLAALFLFNTVLGEELPFRGYLLPRMRSAFGDADWLTNGALFGAYHLHMPWAIPASIVNGLIFAHPSKRQRSALVGIIIHSIQSVGFLGLTLSLVLS